MYCFQKNNYLCGRFKYLLVRDAKIDLTILRVNRQSELSETGFRQAFKRSCRVRKRTMNTISKVKKIVKGIVKFTRSI